MKWVPRCCECHDVSISSSPKRMHVNRSGRYWVYVTLGGAPLGKAAPPPPPAASASVEVLSNISQTSNTSIAKGTRQGTVSGGAVVAEEDAGGFVGLEPSSRGSPFNIFISSGAPDVGAAQLLGLKSELTMAGKEQIYLLRMRDLWNNVITQEENITMRATVAVGNAADMAPERAFAGHEPRIGTRPISEMRHQHPGPAESPGESYRVDPIAKSNTAAWLAGSVEEHATHSHQLEVFPRISSIGSYGFLGDTMLEWVPTASGVYNISIVVTQKIPTSTDPTVSHLHVPGSPFSVRVTAGPSYPPNAWGHESFEDRGRLGSADDDAAMDKLAGRLEKGTLVSGDYSINRKFIFYDRDLFGNLRDRGGESWAVSLRGIHLGSCRWIQEKVLDAVLSLCPGAGVAGLGVGRSHGLGGLFNLTMGVCDRRAQIHTAAGPWPSSPSPHPQHLLDAGVPDTFIDNEMLCLFQRNAAECAPSDCCNQTASLYPHVKHPRTCANLHRCASARKASSQHGRASGAGSRNGRGNTSLLEHPTLGQLLQYFFRYAAAGCPVDCPAFAVSVPRG